MMRVVVHPIIPVFLLIALFAGCKSGKIVGSSYSAPRVLGRVVDALTGAPLAHTKVRRVFANQPSDASHAEKGGALMQQPQPIRTDETGRFDMASEQVFGFFGNDGWYAVTLSFEHPGYARYLTNFSLADVSTNAPPGEPIVEAGDIRLQPLSR